ncbi:hypothetical protein PBI_SCTP2_202 [Salicola phage SCTP-2]|nr:hypothetical protein PBI_SCTP2_202 [Salicola phage SCTP-2]
MFQETTVYKSYSHDLESKAKQAIDEGSFDFFLRTLSQQKYHPRNINQFTEKRFEIAYILSDMAVLCDNDNVANYVAAIANKIRDDSDNLTEDEQEYMSRFISKGRDKYSKTDYVDLISMEDSD